ncbi:Stp1/IreP family PP2C-type Ser/Thr phosphatase [Clostridium sp. MCC353]|uniref:Stp1/IreP family PP2C-type Ser/Thr phosphatase n=1 Tax=Clostridium sp. MCC353 TaxID=2592646 RepID=UPI001C01042E|nr:Stp1/IreP family PP2C-type Ser/Thr phosphatase [Clostridium sp. MCC353]MBT9779282.1 Stp1/IreP family PP2C-type Ser/Thr phosphatase [Clostridium sp. MCC353]
MQAYALTDVGRVRTMNQDYIFSSSAGIGSLANLFIVADGMGGHKAGDYASRFMVEQLVEYMNHQESMGIVPALESGIQKINRELYEKSIEDERLSGMGTTLVAATVDQDTLYVANIGDSRLYVVGEQIRQVTKDHSYVEEMVSLGQMERGSEDYQANKNIITRAVGTKDTLNIDFFEVTLNPGEYILLCSDGLSNMVEDEEIRRIVSSDRNLKQKTEDLVSEANHHGGKDNIAVILIDPQLSEVRSC